jgi:hypothetical protein
MISEQIAAKKTLYRRFRNLSENDAKQVMRFIDDLEAYEPNEETIEVLEDIEARRNMVGPFNSLEAMLSDFGINADR